MTTISEIGVVATGLTGTSLIEIEQDGVSKKITTGLAKKFFSGVPDGGTTGQALTKLSATDGDANWQTLTKSSVGLSAVDNTADIGKPISTATQTALNGKENTINSGTVFQYWMGNKSWQNLFFNQSYNNAAPNNIIPVVVLTPNGLILEDNAHIALKPKGTGGFSLNVPDGAALGGGVRGEYSVDLSVLRSVSSQVASGDNSTIGGGGSNTASGISSTVSGGRSNTASGDRSTVSGGAGNIASGADSTVSGGAGNIASGADSTVSGGSNNIANAVLANCSGSYANSRGISRSRYFGSGFTARHAAPRQIGDIYYQTAIGVGVDGRSLVLRTSGAGQEYPLPTAAFGSVMFNGDFMIVDSAGDAIWLNIEGAATTVALIGTPVITRKQTTNTTTTAGWGISASIVSGALRFTLTLGAKSSNCFGNLHVIEGGYEELQ